MLTTEQLQENWYNNKELFEMLQNLGKEISELRIELRETTTKIRDYNGLRDDVRKYVDEVHTLKTIIKSKSEIFKDVRFNIYNIIMATIAAIAVLVAVLK